jgi:hypothetical protein
VRGAAHLDYAIGELDLPKRDVGIGDLDEFPRGAVAVEDAVVAAAILLLNDRLKSSKVSINDQVMLFQGRPPLIGLRPGPPEVIVERRARDKGQHQLPIIKTVNNRAVEITVGMNNRKTSKHEFPKKLIVAPYMASVFGWFNTVSAEPALLCGADCYDRGGAKSPFENVMDE